MSGQSSDLLFNEAKFVHIRFCAKPSFDLDITTYIQKTYKTPIQTQGPWYHFY